MNAAKGKKVVILGSAWPLRGGLAAYNERLAHALTAAGYDVEIYTFSLQYPGFLFPGKTQYSDAPQPGGLKIKVCINSINPFNWIKIGRRLCRLKPELLIIKFWIPFMSPCLGTIARIARRNRHTKVISILDNVIPHEKRPGDNALIRYFIRTVDGFIAMSKSVATDLYGFLPHARLKMNPHPLYDHFGSRIGREQALEQLGLSKEYRYFLFFGFIRDYKGLDILLDAMAHQAVISCNAKLIVAGEFYTDSAPYLQQIEQLSLSRMVILATDFIPDDKVALYFSACDLVVQPYKSATQSGVTQIAYHFEKPMIVTDVGGLSEIVPHGRAGYVVSPDGESIANAIRRFYDSGGEEAFKEGLQEEKKKYSWEQMVDTIVSLLNEIQQKQDTHAISK
jgi:D-inositol-3-phosphate glycosyltransferase